MKKKSKFIAFLLSPLPGLSHLYVGFPERALIFFGLFITVFMGGKILQFSLLGPLLFFGIAIIWFIALVDVFFLVDYREISDSDEENNSVNKIPLMGVTMQISNRKLIAIALSIIPGAGHMYLGMLKKGTQLMAAFFLTMFLTGSLNMGFLAFALPVLWFYSLFDVYHLIEEVPEGLRPDESELFSWFDNHPGWIGWSLIILGVLIILQKVVTPIIAPLLNPDIRNYLQTGIVALILIAGGIKLLAGNKNEHSKEDL
jgi:TM2 domain-containing membrane protein YozV